MLDINNNIEDKIFSETNGNFQTMNMIHKIKKIKKKRKQPENIKKIPFPEVLTNVNEKELEQHFKLKKDKELAEDMSKVNINRRIFFILKYFLRTFWSMYS